MVLKDFFTGGFPIGKTAPVICYGPDGNFAVAYDSSSLKRILTENEVIGCVGVWPGKMNTDCFILSKEHYSKKAPPVGHEKIGSSFNILLIFSAEAKFLETKYKLREPDGREMTYVSNDPELARYVISEGLRHTTEQQQKV